MTLYLLFERLDAGKIRLDTAIEGVGACVRAGADQARPQAGQTIAVEDAIKAMVTRVGQ